MVALFAVCAACQANRDELTSTEVGDAPYCENVAVWPSVSVELENELLDAIERARLEGPLCPAEESDEDGETGTGGGPPPEGGVPVLPLTLSPELRCAARMRALDLIRGADDESDPLSTFERLVRAGYTGLPRHEALAFDYLEADEVIEAWLQSPEHCAAILDRGIDDVGAGRARSSRGDDVAWVVVTGEDRE